MSTFRDLLQNARDRPSGCALDPARMAANIQGLRDVRNIAAADDEVSGPPQGRVRVVGDPEIVDVHGAKLHYLGPALLVIHDDRGMVRALEFVGVGDDDDYINEVWHLDVLTGQYKYQNLSPHEGARITLHQDREPEFHAGASSWTSERSSNAKPSREFLRQFRPDSETFFVDSRRGLFVRGPKYGLLQRVLENPKLVVKSLFSSNSMDAEVWMKQAATLASDPSRNAFARPCKRMQAVQVAQLAYGLAACRVV